MKRLILLAIIATMASVQAWAQPILVGHRGSYYGVENTAESFINGAKRGYQYLETDVKVTKDGKHVCSHNDDLKSVGGTLTIASSNLADLQAEDLSQTRGGVKYTGHLCSISEYLDICNEYNVKPLIELKWATHINSNDCTGIPALIKEIEGKGFRNSCIILTSMKPCLEYIRTYYPDIELQFLTGEYWANHFDWCVKWGIDVNIQATYFDRSTVQKFHDEDLKVNMWTTNTKDGYRTYANMGCDFITTDYLDPADLPELDESVIFPANTMDFPPQAGEVMSSYELVQIASVPFPAELSGKNIKRAILRNGNWTVLVKDASATPLIYIIDAKTGEVKGTVKTAGNNISDIAYSADGYLVGCNSCESGSELNIWQWSSLSASPELLYRIPEVTNSTVPAPEYLDHFNLGQTMAVSGRIAKLKVYLSAEMYKTPPTPDASVEYEPLVRHGIVAIQTNTGETAVWLTADYDEGIWGGMLAGNTPFCRDNVLIYSPYTNKPTEYRVYWNNPSAPLELKQSFPESIDVAGPISYLRYGSRIYALAAVKTNNGYEYRIYNVTNGLALAKKASQGFTAHIDPSTFSACGIEIGDKNNIALYSFSENGGLEVYETMPYVPEFIEEIDLKVEREWILSNTTNNKPEHIDGTNAQQGTGANGLIYVNDCADKKLYIFDSTGCLGSLPGGAGWGCCRDDKGNIIVRDDKSDSATHSFIIYPAGTTIGDDDKAVKMEIEFSLAGQTNFINASGNVLEGTGYIYLFPNGNNRVSIVELTAGRVSDSLTSDEIMLTANAAGYVIPQNNDPESFIYQVRTTGLYTYKNGTSEALSTTRYTTTAPGRNSTGGGAMFKIRGNEIFVHNSGANYKGGLTVKNHSENDKVIVSYDPIGTLGYETGGNYSTFNWLIPERIGYSNAYRLYQYCPSNGMASYIVYDSKTYEPMSVNDIAVDSGNDRPAVYFDLQGRSIQSIDNAAPGIYIMRKGNSTTKIAIR